MCLVMVGIIIFVRVIQHHVALTDSIEAIIVYLDGNCRLGHSVYANSDNNGPWGDALVKEFIPELEKQYRCDGARLLRGHSSGGWTVLWLQTHYPSVFTACWSSSPDPVDFRDFQKINLYEGENLYYAKDSSLRMVATVAGRFPWVSMKARLFKWKMWCIVVNKCILLMRYSAAKG